MSDRALEVGHRLGQRALEDAEKVLGEASGLVDGARSTLAHARASLDAHRRATQELADREDARALRGTTIAAMQATQAYLRRRVAEAEVLEATCLRAREAVMRAEAAELDARRRLGQAKASLEALERELMARRAAARRRLEQREEDDAEDVHRAR